MKTSILGTGMVGTTIAERLSALGHDVFLGTRNADETRSRTEKNKFTGVVFSEWLKNNPMVTLVNYGDLPGDSSIFINATHGSGSIEALKAVGKDKLRHKIILDIANPLDFSKGMPPSLFICNTDSLGERIQNEFPDSNVVKSLNTMNCQIMMNPSIVDGDHDVFMSGNSSDAKKEIKSLLVSLGWKEANIIDLGDISTARGTEMLLPLWIRLMGALGTAQFNFHVSRS
jgi:8-hydroxy-5-deazaflavin:NADPH oxidoreductase